MAVQSDAQTSTKRRHRPSYDSPILQPFDFEWELVRNARIIDLQSSDAEYSSSFQCWNHPTLGYTNRTTIEVRTFPADGLWIGGENSSRHIRPLKVRPEVKQKNPGLHRKFSMCSTDAELIKFTKVYGLLGRENWLICPVAARHGVIAQPLRWVRTQVAKIRYLIELWDGIQSSDIEKVERISELLDLANFEAKDSASGCRYYVPKNGQRVLIRQPCDSNSDIDNIADFNISGVGIKLTCQPPGDPSNPAFIETLLDIPDHPERKAVAKEIVLEQVNIELSKGSYPRISTDGGTEPYYLAPIDLIGAIYICFMSEILGGVPASRQCMCGCGDWFSPTTGQQKYIQNPDGSGNHRHRRYAADVRSRTPEEM